MNYEQVVSERDSVTHLRLRAGKVNAIGLRLVEELDHAMRTLAADPAVRAVVLSGGDSRFFSYGLDVAQLLELDHQQLALFFDHFCRLVRDLHDFPKPLVAAVNGHAMGGGFLVAAAADARIGTGADYTWGLPEVRLGLAVPYAAVRVMRRRWGERTARRLCLEGASYPGAEALEQGVVDEVAAPDDLLPRARARAGELADLPAEAYALGKRYLDAGTFDADPKAEAEENHRWVEAWFRPETRELVTRLANRA